MKQSILSIISITMLLICGIVYAQQVTNPAQTTTPQGQLPVQQQAIFDANLDVGQQVSAIKWFLLGAGGSIITFAYAVVDTPQEPTTRLLGKSPDYVTVSRTDRYH